MTNNTDAIGKFFARTETHRINGIDFVFAIPTAEDSMKIDKIQQELAKVMPTNPHEKMSAGAVKLARDFQIACVKGVLHCGENDARRIVVATGQSFYNKVSDFLGLDKTDLDLTDPT